MSMQKGRIPDFETALQDSLDAIADSRLSISECLAKYPTHADDLAPMLYMASSLRDARSVRPSLGFRKQARSRMQQRIAASSRKPLSLTETRKARQPQPKRGLFGFPSLVMRALIALIVVALLASVTGVTAYAADSAAPGDTLYPVDRAVERITLRFTFTTDGRLNLQLAIANERMAEAEALINAGQDAYANEALLQYDQTVVEIEATADQVDPEDRNAAQEKVKQNLDKHIAKMTELLDKVPPQARANIERHIQKTIDKANKHNQNGSDDGPGNSGNNGNGNGNGNAGGNGNGNDDDPDSEPNDSGSNSSGNTSGDDQSTPDEDQGTGNGNGNGNGNSNGNGNGNNKDNNHPGKGNGNGHGGSQDNDDSENDNSSN